jgi:N-acetylglucosamine-6-phosphate deacetylase
MLIKNANVFGADGKFRPDDVIFSDIIRHVGCIDGHADIDAEGGYLIPGLIDIHTHGAMGCDASDGDAAGLETMARYYAAHGVTSFCATTMTLPEDTLTRAMHTIRDYRRPKNGARCVGVYLEGPFLSQTKKGAQAAEYIHSPDIDMFMRLYTAAGEKIRAVGIAPEQPGSGAFIKVVSQLCTLSLAHTAADYATAAAAYEVGASQATHLFNGMNPFLHREPGVVGAALDSGAYVELICDGLHVHPAAIRGAFRMFPGKIVLISDSLRCAGMPDGSYELGGQPIVVRNGKATLLDGTLAGSCISLLDAVKNVVQFGVPLEQAVEAATLAPARALRIAHMFGSIEPDKAADMLILGSDLKLKYTIIGGEVIQ